MDAFSQQEFANIISTGTGIECKLFYVPAVKGRPLADSGELECQACAQQLDQQFNDETCDDTAFSCGHSHFASWLALQDAQGDDAAVILVQCADTLRVEQRHALQHWLQLLQPRIASEYLREQELNAMATELADRYDELNLVFTQDHNDIADVPLDEAIETSLHNCLQHLNLSAVALDLQHKHVFVVQSKSPKERTLAELLYQMVLPISERMQSHPHSLVDNEGFESALIAMPSHKLIAVPIIASNGHYEGLLAGLRHADGEDYSNSDRNLMDVMGRQLLSLLNQNYDSLTGSLNRPGFERRLAQTLKSSAHSEHGLCLLNIDLDDFHVINDSMGFKVGDELLKQVASLIHGLLSPSDVLARIGSNEFGVLLSERSLEDCETLADELKNRIKHHRYLNGENSLSVSASIGLLYFNDRYFSPTDLISNAELACSTAKENGKNSVYSVSSNVDELIERRKQVSWVGRLREALDHERFEMYAQAIEALTEGHKHHHCEILIRLKDDEGNILSPAEFLPAAERYRLMPDIDMYVLRHTLDQIRARKHQLKGRQLKFAINLSGQTLGQADLSKRIINMMLERQLEPAWFTLEVTESATINNMHNAKEFILEMKKFGVTFSLDDFGTGMSSLAYLKKLPVDYLKIDGIFIRDVDSQVSEWTMVRAVHQIARSLGLKTIAEFVSNESIVKTLRQIGIDYAQGYHFAKPIPLSEYLEDIVSSAPSQAQRAPWT